LSLYVVEIQDPNDEDRINIYDDDPAKRNLQVSERKTKTKDSAASAYHCVGPSSSKEASTAKTAGGAKRHHYQEVHSFHLGDRYEVHHPKSVGEIEIRTATAYETPITRKDRVSL
jgi:hypothetical protein